MDKQESTDLNFTEELARQRSCWYIQLIAVILGVIMFLTALIGAIAITSWWVYAPYWFVHTFMGEGIHFFWKGATYIVFFFMNAYLLWNIATFSERRNAKKYLPIQLQDIETEKIRSYILKTLQARQRSRYIVNDYRVIFDDLIIKIDRKMINEDDLKKINQILKPKKFADAIYNALNNFVEKVEDDRKRSKFF